MKTLEQRIAEIPLEKQKYPEWYRPKLEEAIKFLGPRWTYHPDNTMDLRRKAA